MTDILDINLRLGDVTLTLKIHRNEEATLREASKQVNHAYKAYSERFADKSSREIMAMVTLLFAKGYVTASEQNQEVTRTLAEFESELDKLLLGNDENLISLQP